MKTIWKYKIQEHEGSQFIEVPEGAKFLSAIAIYGSPALYALVDPVAPIVQTEILIKWTGAMSLEGYLQTHIFLGTIKLYKGELILHVFVEKKFHGG